MQAQDFLVRLDKYLSGLKDGVQYGNWQYLGVTDIYFNTPGGSWDPDVHTGYRFIDLKEEYEFIIRSIPPEEQESFGYLVVESISGNGQLTNLRLDQRTYREQKDMVELLEAYRMTVGGYGRISEQEVRHYFMETGFDENGLITSFHKSKIDFLVVINDILNWSVLRERVKNKIHENRSKEGMAPQEEVEYYEVINHKAYKHRSPAEMEPRLDADFIAYEMAHFINGLNRDSPVLLGLFGNWGRGKTYMFNLIWKHLNHLGGFHRVDFHAWKHQETPASWGYMYEAVAEKYYNESRNWFHRKLRVLKLNWVRYHSYGLILLVASIAGAITWGVLRYYVDLEEGDSIVIPTLSSALGVSFIALIIKTWKDNSASAKKIYKKYTTKHSYGQLLGLQAEIQKELKTLLCTWIRIPKGERHPKSRVLLFVDDLDRCSEGKIMQIIDSLRVMLDDSEIARRIVVIVAVDERILYRAIRMKYENMIEGLSDSREDLEVKLMNLTREYLDKLFISGIKLGKLSEFERLEIFDALTKDKVDLPEEEPDVEVKVVQKETDGTTKEQIPKIVPEKPKRQGPSRNSDFEISSIEYRYLKNGLKKLSDATPRQIRIFYLRYLLTREFLKNVKGYEDWKERDARIVIETLAYLNEQNLIDENVRALVEALHANPNVPELQMLWNELPEDIRVDYAKMLEMVVAY